MQPNGQIFKTAWEAPSNIALVKYWGKRPVQLPLNPSVSFSLKNAKTQTSITYLSKNSLGNDKVHLLFDGKRRVDFEQRIKKFITELEKEKFSELSNYDLQIESSNTFPHSAGIASSASAMAALCLNLVEFKKFLNEDNESFSKDDFIMASNYSRLASGSASRSIFGGTVLWGKTDCGLGNDIHGVQLTDIHSIFDGFQDTILLVSKDEKTVSSSEGHARMDEHPFADARIKQANKNTTSILSCLKSGDLEGFGKIVQNEALTLHSMMMTSNDPFLLLEAKSVDLIKKLLIAQKEGLKVWFTLDAGPNLHLLHHSSEKSALKLFLDEVGFNPDNVFEDEIGEGPRRGQ